ncbi:uncharacterized protein LOC112196577 isoform X2 [Rosa chinensis]|uniref:uncharacterized protein LOC112196577 isoform X2 n=1 Tax=Rosa chinensis TaxID=74649 RepID=UPI001AD94A7D|nr:uncharacterized protein LOC112196577 isoform X2 [Rosa chinensis]
MSHRSVQWTDVLKWMDSHTSLSNLEGFFLRLRLGKSETGLGGTRYYVSCITGSQRESHPQNAKKSISVIVGEIRCVVEAQYVSNHDFLEALKFTTNDLYSLLFASKRAEISERLPCIENESLTHHLKILQESWKEPSSWLKESILLSSDDTYIHMQQLHMCMFYIVSAFALFNC